jgi:hypothetical protein
MDNNLTLEKITTLVERMCNETPDLRVDTYVTIAVLINQLKGNNADAPNIDSYTTELLWSCGSLCGIDTGNDLPEENHITWCKSAICKLRSIHCLNIEKSKKD